MSFSVGMGLFAAREGEGVFNEEYEGVFVLVSAPVIGVSMVKFSRMCTGSVMGGLGNRRGLFS